MDQEVLYRDIDTLGLSVRCHNLLVAEGIFYVGDLAARSEFELLMVPGVGQGALGEIRSALDRIGIRTLGRSWPREERHSSTAPKRHVLDGMFFHTFTEDGQLQYQARVVGVDGDVVLAQMYSALDGSPTNVMPFEKALLYSDNCKLYAYPDLWRAKYREACASEQARPRKPARQAATGRHMQQVPSPIRSP